MDQGHKNYTSVASLRRVLRWLRGGAQ